MSETKPDKSKHTCPICYENTEGRACGEAFVKVELCNSSGEVTKKRRINICYICYDRFFNDFNEKFINFLIPTLREALDIYYQEPKKYQHMPKRRE